MNMLCKKVWQSAHAHVDAVMLFTGTADGNLMDCPVGNF